MIQMSDIAIHPEYLKLINEIKELKEDLKKQIYIEDELKYHVCKEIETEYMRKIGYLEYKVYFIFKIGYLEYKVFKKETELLMLKKEIKLIQKAINLEEKVDIKTIEKQIEIEYEESIEKLEKELDKITEIAKKPKGEPLSKENNKLLKDTYKELIFKLHPDLNEDLSKEDEILFVKVVEAYEDGDVETLVIFNEIVTNDLEDELLDDLTEIPEGKTDPFEKYNKKITFLINKIDLKNKDIDKIKSSHPYNKKELLWDSEEVEKVKNDLNELLEEYELAYDNYTEKLEELKSDLNEEFKDSKDKR